MSGRGRRRGARPRLDADDDLGTRFTLADVADAHRAVESGTADGNRLSPPYERDPRNYLALLGLAAALCCYKRLVLTTQLAGQG